MKSMRLYRLTFLFAAIALFGLGLGYSIARFHPGDVPSGGVRSREDENTGAALLAPASLDQLVGSSDVIVIGTFHSVVNESRFYGYDEGALKRAELDKDSSNPLSVPITDFEVAVEKTLRDDSRHPISESLIVRIVAHKDEPGMPQIGDRRLLFLRATPDNNAYGMTSFVSQVDINGDMAIYRKGNQEMLPFGKRINSENFVEQIEHILRKPPSLRLTQ